MLDPRAFQPAGERDSHGDRAGLYTSRLSAARNPFAFWLEDDQRRHFKVFKPTADVVPGDLPPGWLKDVLCAEWNEELDCC